MIERGLLSVDTCSYVLCDVWIIYICISLIWELNIDNTAFVNIKLVFQEEVTYLLYKHHFIYLGEMLHVLFIINFSKLRVMSGKTGFSSIRSHYYMYRS